MFSGQVHRARTRVDAEVRHVIATSSKKPSKSKTAEKEKERKIQQARRKQQQQLNRKCPFFL
jgi:hypothetical protein